jgi:hypothetical protein
MLFAAHVMCDGNAVANVTVAARIFMPPMARASDINHDCAKWVRASSQNYQWTAKLFSSLCLEYEIRMKRIHPMECFVDLLKKQPKLIPMGELTPFVQCVPVRDRGEDAVTAYRRYMRMAKRNMMQWTYPSKPPFWYDPSVLDMERQGQVAS